MSNIIIYLPNEPLGKQGGMEKATHQLAVSYTHLTLPTKLEV